MKEYVKNVGDTGKLIIQDKTDTAILANKVVDLYVQSLSPVTISSLPWRWYTDTIDPAMSPPVNGHSQFAWNSFRMNNTTLRQHLGMIYVGYSHSFTLVLGPTGTSQMGSGDTFTVDLATVLRPISVKVGLVWKQAIPYVKVAGVWKPAVTMILSDGEWKEAD